MTKSNCLRVNRGVSCPVTAPVCTTPSKSVTIKLRGFDAKSLFSGKFLFVFILIWFCRSSFDTLVGVTAGKLWRDEKERSYRSAKGANNSMISEILFFPTNTVSPPLVIETGSGYRRPPPPRYSRATGNLAADRARFLCAVFRITTFPGDDKRPPSAVDDKR